MNGLIHLDLLSVGIVVTLTCVLGFTVYFSDRKSVTNRLFLAYALITAVWGIVAFSTYHVSNEIQALWSIRALVFFSALQAIAMYELFLVFPNRNYILSRKQKYILFPISVINLILILTPVVFKKIDKINIGSTATTDTGFGIIIFNIFAIGLVLMTVLEVYKKIKLSRFKPENAPIKIIFSGLVISYSLIVIFNSIFPSLLKITFFTPYSSFFVFPTIASTSYAILKHKLLNIKATQSVILICITLLVTFLSVVYSNNLSEIVLRGVIFILTIIVSIFLLKVVIQEADQRIQIQQLAKSLEQANSQLKDAIEVKNEFTALATHNISAPLTAVNGYLSMLKEDYSSELSKEGKEILSVTEKATHNLVTIIRDFIDVSRLDRNKITYNLEKIDLKDVIEKVFAEYKNKVESLKLQFVLNINPNETFIVDADREKVEQAISNILDNSIKYTKTGKIEIQLLKVENTYTISIIDTGYRNMPEVSETLSKKFSQLGDMFTASILAHGMGVYVAKQYIEAQKGTFTIKSDNGHMTFIIGFPSNPQ